MLNSNFATRLNEAIKLRQIKPAEIVRISEEMFKNGKINKPLTKPLLSHYLKGTYEAKQDNVYALSLILNVDEAWLMGYDVSIDGKTKVAEIDVISLITNETIQKIPYTYRSDIADEDPKNFFAIYATDNSMAPLLDVGDIAILKKYKNFSNKKTYLLRIKNGDPIIRKVIQADDEKIELQAMNMWNFPTQKGLTMDDLKFLGEVVKVENNSAFK